MPSTSAHALLGSSNFTVPGLGLKPSGSNVELNIAVDGRRDVDDLKAWFEELWNDPSVTTDAREKVLTELDRLYADSTPPLRSSQGATVCFPPTAESARADDGDWELVTWLAVLEPGGSPP